eukprot:3153315-Prorocentrum_lima.AAC.1
MGPQHYIQRHQAERAAAQPPSMTDRARANSIYMLIHASATGFINQLHPNITDDLDFTGRHQRRRIQT